VNIKAELCIYIWEMSVPTPAMIQATLGVPQSLQVKWYHSTSQRLCKVPP